MKLLIAGLYILGVLCAALYVRGCLLLEVNEDSIDNDQEKED